MMTSYAENIKPILDVIAELRPMKTLDVGSAFGKYGLLIRELQCSLICEDHDLEPVEVFQIDCMEKAQYFIKKKYHEHLYDNHFHIDARTHEWETIPKYNLVLLIDVVEHWSKEEGIRIIKAIKEHTGAKVLVSTPREVVMYEKDYYGTDCPKHQSQWKASDFIGINFDAKNVSTPQSYIFLI